MGEESGKWGHTRVHYAPLMLLSLVPRLIVTFSMKTNAVQGGGGREWVWRDIPVYAVGRK